MVCIGISEKKKRICKYLIIYYPLQCKKIKINNSYVSKLLTACVCVCVCVCNTSRSISNSRSSRSHFGDSSRIVRPGCPTHLDFQVTVRVNLLHSAHLSKGLFRRKHWHLSVCDCPKQNLMHLTHFPFPQSSEMAGMLGKFMCKLCVMHRYKHPSESNILSTVEGERERDVVVGGEKSISVRFGF